MQRPRFREPRLRVSSRRRARARSNAALAPATATARASDGSDASASAANAPLFTHKETSKIGPSACGAGAETVRALVSYALATPLRAA